MAYDVIIVGAGPAGLFAAYELSTNSKLKIALIDKGKRAKKRNPDNNKPFSHVMCGIGGSGLFSDGKLGFTPIASLETLYDFLDSGDVQPLLDKVETIFEKFGLDSETYPKNKKEVKKLIDNARQHGLDLKVKKLRHIGSDILPNIIHKFENFLIKKGVDILDSTEVTELLVEKKKIKGVKTVKKVIKAKYVLVCPGRVGTTWLNEQLSKLGVKKISQPILVGVRVEFPASILENIAKKLWEPFFYIRTKTFDDTVRTFCTCPYGYVVLEVYDKFIAVNGHSTSKTKSQNSNFALLSRVALTEPVEDTISYGKSIAILTTTIGGGKPILQRYADLKKGRRSTWDRINKSYIHPTFKDVTPGDISMALPHRVVTNIIEALEKLDKVIPGVASDATLLYAPEVKFTSAKIETDKNLQTKITNLYVAGDGAGVSGNIVGAAATGLIAVDGILKNEKA